MMTIKEHERWTAERQIVYPNELDYDHAVFVIGVFLVGFDEEKVLHEALAVVSCPFESAELVERLITIEKHIDDSITYMYPYIKFARRKFPERSDVWDKVEAEWKGKRQYSNLCKCKGPQPIYPARMKVTFFRWMMKHFECNHTPKQPHLIEWNENNTLFQEKVFDDECICGLNDRLNDLHLAKLTVCGFTFPSIPDDHTYHINHRRHGGR